MNLKPRQAGWTFYRATLLLASFVVLLTTPIGNPANSVWHHLVQGRSLLDASEAFEPGWLFSLLLFFSHHAGGDTGLVIVRAIFHALWLAGVARYIVLHGRRESQGWLAFVFALIVLLSFEHAFDLDSTAATLPVAILLLSLLETDGKLRWLFPALTILWVNLDASGLPIVVLIYGAYTAELLTERAGSETVDGRRQQRLATLALGLAAIFATPQGVAIAKWILPHDSASNAGGALSGDLDQGLRLAITPGAIGAGSLGLLLVGVGALALLGNLADRRLRTSHGVLAGGCALLVAAEGRLTPSMMVLLLPAIVDHGMPWPKAWPKLLGSRRYGAITIVVALALVAPFCHLLQRRHGGAFELPLAAAELPRGTATFLARLEAPLDLMYPPAEADFWRWTLHVPEPGATEPAGAAAAHALAMFELGSAFVDRDALRRYLKTHAPDFIVVPLAARTFPALLESHSQYRPIFFDDASVLYADLRDRPALVAHELLIADPLALPQMPLGELPPERRQQLRAELESLYRIDPRIARVAGTLAALDVLDDAPEVALERLRQALAEQGARQASLHTARGNALRARGDLAGAIHSYRRAVEVAADEPDRQAARRSLATSLSLAGDPQGAFQALERAVGRFNVTASASDLLFLAELGAAAGERSAARTYLDFAALQLPPKNVAGVDGGRAELDRKIELARVALGSDR